MNILQCFLAFLNMPDHTLALCINMYNLGQLSENARIALEAIESMAADKPSPLVIYQYRTLERS